MSVQILHMGHPDHPANRRDFYHTPPGGWGPWDSGPQPQFSQPVRIVPDRHRPRWRWGRSGANRRGVAV